LTDNTTERQKQTAMRATWCSISTINIHYNSVTSFTFLTNSPVFRS